MPHASRYTRLQGQQGHGKGVGGGKRGEWWERVKRVKDSRRADDSQLATKVPQTDNIGVWGE